MRLRMYKLLIVPGWLRRWRPSKGVGPISKRPIERRWKEPPPQREERIDTLRRVADELRRQQRA